MSLPEIMTRTSLLAAALWAAALAVSPAAVMAVVRTSWVFQDNPQTITLPTDDLLAGWVNRPSYDGDRNLRQSVDVDGDGVPELEFYGRSSALLVLISSHAEILSSHIPPPNADNSTYVIPVLRGNLLGPDTLDRYQYQGIPPTLWYGSDAQEDHVLGIGFGDPNNYGAYFPHQQKPPYVALRFKRNGEWHYGWVQVNSYLDSMGAINGWGWETEANTPIIVGMVPEPSAALLAACAAGMLWRRKRNPS
jgi:hypothetical protein